MKGVEIGYWIFLLIMAFLLINNGSQTSTVINAIGGQFTNAVTALQGKGTGATAGV